MYHHLTLIRLRAGAPAQAVRDALLAARELEREVPAVIAMSCGEALPDPAHDWQLAFAFTFADRAGFEAFASHPAHERLVHDHIQPQQQSIVSVDYEDGSGTPANTAVASAPADGKQIR